MNAEAPAHVRELVKDIHDAIAELAGVARYPDLTEAIDKLAALAAAQPAWDPVAWGFMFNDARGLGHQLEDSRAEIEVTWRREIVDGLGDPVPVYASPPAAAAPAGWKLVPVEPTEAMFTAFDAQIEGGPVYLSDFLRAYRAMLGAAPDAPKELKP